tara:strand:+ start:245 stop:475 length:231 start_codon:yes stop_codon:yes gene_type:complete
MLKSWTDIQNEKFLKSKIVALDEDDEPDPDFWVDLIHSDLKEEWTCDDLIMAIKLDISEGLKVDDLFEKYLVEYVK